MASRGCLHPADSFCYMCGQFIKTRVKKYSVEASRIICEAYKAYFGDTVGVQDKSWAPHFTCEYCKKTLEGFGTMIPMGHADFYPNGGGYQPGCPPPIRKTLQDVLTLHMSAGFTTISCSHDRAIWYFIESVLNNKCQFVAYQCTSVEEYNARTCKTCRDRPCQEMGINGVKFNGTGTFYLTTNPAPLFCNKGQW